MQTYDLIMLAVLAAAVVFGALKGLAWQIASLSALFVSYFVAMNFYPQVAPLIKTEEPWNKFLAMFILYIGSSLAIWIAFGLVRRLIDRVQLKDFDRHLGAVLGAVNGVIFCVIITLFAVTLLRDDQKEAVCRSHSGYLIAHGIEKVRVGMPDEVKKVVKPYLDRLDKSLEEGQSSQNSRVVNEPSPHPMIVAGEPIIVSGESHVIPLGQDGESLEFDWREAAVNHTADTILKVLKNEDPQNR